MKSIDEIQDEIIEEFSVFDDWMDKYALLNDFGQLGIVEVQIVGGYGESGNKRTCIAALVLVPVLQDELRL